MRRLSMAGGLVLLAISLGATAAAQEPPQWTAGRRLTPEQRQAAVERARQVRQARGAALVTRLDRNADGAVSREEWPRAAAAFERLDANKDGILDREELARAPLPQRVRMARLRERRLRVRMRVIDTDRDGRISQEEWKARPDGFARLDANKDGFLTPQELRRGMMPRGPRK